MTKRVGIADLKARLSEHLRAVRRGNDILVVDRGTPVARIVPATPVTPLVTRKPTRDLHSIALPPPLPYRVDALQALLEERGER
jgi:prevent-host-death family protein